MSPTYFVFGVVAVKSRPIRSGAFGAAGSRDGGTVPAPQPDALEPDCPHDPRDPLVVDHLAAAVVAELSGDPRGAIGAVGVLVDLAYPGGEPGVSGLPGLLAGALRRQ